MRKINYYENNLDTANILTDFSVTLDLRTQQTNNWSVNNYAVLDIYYVLNNFRKVKL